MPNPFEGLSNDAPEVALWTPVPVKGSPSVGLEHLIVGASFANGLIIALDAMRQSFRLNYRIEWDSNWCTRLVQLESETVSGKRKLMLRADGEGHWWNEDEASCLHDYDGCVDVDLWPSAFTNTLPIRRLNLDVGARAEIHVVYVEAPSLLAAPSRQAYSRLPGRRSYGFSSLDTEFSAEFETDKFGLLLDYPGLFKRIDGSQPTDTAHGG